MKIWTKIFASLWKSACKWKAAKNAKVFTLWRCGKFLCDECLAAARWEDGKSVWSRVRPAFWVKCRWSADKMFALGCSLLTSFGVKWPRAIPGQNLPLLFHSHLTMVCLGVYQRINNRIWVETKVSVLVFECHVLVSRKLNFINKWLGLCTGSRSFWAVNRLLHFPAAAVLPKHLVLVSPSAAPQPLPNILCGETCPPMVAHHPILAPIHHKAPRDIFGYKQPKHKEYKPESCRNL